MYSVLYDGKCRTFNSWREALKFYDGLYPTVKELYIRDNEYGTLFINFSWEQDENLVGWCRK